MLISVKRIVCAAAFILAVSSASAHANGQRDAVVDKRNNPVRDARGDCVLTKWTEANDMCDKKAAAPQPQPVQEKIAAITKAERTVLFDFNKSELNTEAMNKIDDLLVKVGSAKEVVRGNIVGYADEMGKDEYNRALSNRRAESVKGYLVARGFKNIGVVEVRGLGESGSITHCAANLKRQAKIDCLRQDRRVEIELEMMQ
ncbi:MAG: hypothetical protein EB060_01575 [Proteobacteria bacterium]|nr:hypothetical protein [Pseudomonadota bacterium]